MSGSGIVKNFPVAREAGLLAFSGRRGHGHTRSRAREGDEVSVVGRLHMRLQRVQQDVPDGTVIARAATEIAAIAQGLVAGLALLVAPFELHLAVRVLKLALRGVAGIELAIDGEDWLAVFLDEFKNAPGIASNPNGVPTASEPPS